MAKYAKMVPPEQAVRLEITNPFNMDEPLVRSDGKECWIDLYPWVGQRSMEIDRRQTDKGMLLRDKGRRYGGRELHENMLEKLAALTKDWCIGLPDGTPIDDPPTVENCAALYEDMPWLRDTVSRFVMNLGNFPPSPSPNSSPTPSENSD